MTHIRFLRLRSITAEGPFGVDLAFSKGLNILSADNTSGKSTCLQALLYALGLERMLSPRREIPLAYAMRDHLLIEKNQPGPRIHESYVALELEETPSEVLAIKRSVKGGADWRLISNWDAPVFSEPNTQGTQRDFFVRDPGAAQHEAGFHARLANFLGWDLPQVLTYEGRSVPLYLETLFPLLYVEQKAGWSAIQGPYPTYFRIQDVARRSVEFLLDLDAQRIRLQRRELDQRIAEVKSRWSSARDRVLSLARRMTIRTGGMPAEPRAEMAFEGDLMPEVYRNSQWVPLSTALTHDRERLAALRAEEIPRVETEAPQLKTALQEAEALLQALTSERQLASRNLNRCRAEMEAVSRRIQQLEEDRRRNHDALKLRKLGSTLGEAASHSACPTCHQQLHGELLPVDAGEAMTLDENIKFIDSQLSLYRSMRSNLSEQEAALDIEYRAIGMNLDSIRARLRSLRNSLVAPGESPSEATIAERISLEALVREYERFETALGEAQVELAGLASEFVTLLEQQRGLATTDLSRADSSKVQLFSSSVRDQLAEYGFSSFSPAQVGVSPENFRPMVLLRDEEGEEVEAELGFEMSASDAIRLKWAYLLGLLELGCRGGTNHPGFLVFDEPRQQEARLLSFDALIRRAAAIPNAGAQVIFATSETPAEMGGTLDQVRANVIYRAGLLLKRIER